MPVTRERYPTLFRVLPWVITGTMVVAGAAGLLWYSPPPAFPVVQGILFAAAFIVGQRVLIQYHARGMGIAFNLTDIPLVIALFYLPPFWVVATKCFAALLFYAWRYLREDIGVLKPLFNTGLVTAGTTVTVPTSTTSASAPPQTRAPGSSSSPRSSSPGS
jgi:hypothetical protein